MRPMMVGRAIKAAGQAHTALARPERNGGAFALAMPGCAIALHER